MNRSRRQTGIFLRNHIVQAAQQVGAFAGVQRVAAAAVIVNAGARLGSRQACRAAADRTLVKRPVGARPSQRRNDRRITIARLGGEAERAAAIAARRDAAFP